MSEPSERGFVLDPFQRSAMDALSAGESVLVAAPTGSGKTVVAEHAIELALAEGARAFYTSPIKALANQKFGDFTRRYGADDVGLLTGDNTINSHAPIVVMTTEVLRNMLYERSRDLDTLRWVVLDEVHYLQDRFRGPVWEEVILHLDASVQLVSLSATVSNLDEVRDWLETVRGPTELIISTERAVPLHQKLAVARGKNGPIELLPLFRQGKPNRDGKALDVPKSQRYGRNRRRSGAQRTPRRFEVAQYLRGAQLAPAIYFIFSRAGCDDAVRQCSDAGLVFTTSDEQRRLQAILQSHLARIDEADRRSLRLDAWASAFERGFTSHHAGLVPACKEAVEQAFSEGLITIAFATETLALGINMPARSVVIENMSKFNGETHELLTPLEFTQLTGRAGRRGIDDEGTAITLWSPHLPFADLTAVAGSTRYPLRSAFRPSYNMAINLVRRLDRDAAEEVIGRSFAQFQTDSSAVQWRNDITNLRRKLADAEADAHCDYGDIRDYRRLLDRNQGGAEPSEDELAALADEIAQFLTDLRPGQVVFGAEIGHAVVLSATIRSGRPRVQVVHPSGRVSRLDPDDLTAVPIVATDLVLPQPFRPNDEDYHQSVGSELTALGLVGDAGGHPVESCQDAEFHLRALERVHRLERKIERATARMERRGAALVTEFRDIVGLLEALEYVADWTLTDRGDVLAGLYSEGDLLLAEAISLDVLGGLSPEELAAVASCVTYEPRSSNEPPGGRLPTRRSEAAAAALDKIARRLRRTESERLGAPRTPEVERGFAHAAFAWAGDARLTDVIDHADRAGEFVRNTKQLIDLLRQLADSGIDADLADTAAQAAELLDRGVIRVASVTGAGATSDPGSNTDGDEAHGD